MGIVEFRFTGYIRRFGCVPTLVRPRFSLFSKKSDSLWRRFNLPILTDLLGSRSTELINSLHAILKPFLLRRMKCDVEMRLPPKKEYVIYAPLTVRQKEAYECVLEGRIKEWLISGGAGSRNGVMGSAKVKEETKEEAGKGKHGDKRKLRRGSRKSYAKMDGDDDDYFEMLERGELDDDRDTRDSARKSTAAELGKDYLHKSTRTSFDSNFLPEVLTRLSAQ